MTFTARAIHADTVFPDVALIAFVFFSSCVVVLLVMEKKSDISPTCCSRVYARNYIHTHVQNVHVFLDR